MATKLDALLKLSIIAGVLFASASVGYYFLVYLPQRDAQFDAQRAQEKEQADAAREAQQERQAEEAADAQLRYQTCLTHATENYNAVWASNCKRVAEQTLADRATCIYSKEMCNSLYQPRDSSPNCALPGLLAKDLNASLDRARDRCLQESKAGL